MGARKVRVQKMHTFLWGYLWGASARMDWRFVQMVEKKYDLFTFTDKGLSLDVRVDPDEDTVWLTKEQMALLFDRDRSVISRHIRSVYAEGELDEKSTCANYARIPSSRERIYQASMYNLDVVISVGYRVKSSRGILFRKWSSSILKQYLIKGYAIDEKKLLAHEKSIADLSSIVMSLDIRAQKSEDRIKTLEEVANRGELPPECVFYSGDFLDARVFFAGLFAKALNEIIIVDPYSDNKLLSLLCIVADGVHIRIIKGPHSRLSSDDVAAFLAQQGPIDVKESDDFHDRFAFIDDACYHIGASFNHMGSRAFAVMRMEDERVISQLKERIERL